MVKIKSPTNFRLGIQNPLICTCQQETLKLNLPHIFMNFSLKSLPILFGIVVLFSLFSFAHPFFVSMTELIYNQKEKSLEISVRIFTDDLEKELANDCHCKVDLIQKEKHDEMEAILQKYLNKTLKISPNGKPSTFRFVGFEKEEESIWSYLEINNINEINTLQVENKILHNTQKKQSNLIRLKNKDFDKTVQLSYPESSARF
jgi:hypothetical protein